MGKALKKSNALGRKVKVGSHKSSKDVDMNLGLWAENDRNIEGGEKLPTV